MQRTIRFTRRHLPHWEVEAAEYFVTVRCADSLPVGAIERIAELQRHVARIPPRSAEFSALQRQLFRTLEKYLDAGHGACPLRDAACASILKEELAALADWDIAVSHFTLMPNHWHALISPGENARHSLSQIMKRRKGRSARRIRQTIGGRGPVWQREWFDRWLRNPQERARVVDYIRSNPVRAGLVDDWPSHPWTK
ncbi:MAG: transposase [Opitutae bacterium]|nr:transposase [Opitutae bacterium]